MGRADFLHSQADDILVPDHHWKPEDSEPNPTTPSIIIASSHVRHHQLTYRPTTVDAGNEEVPACEFS